MRLTFPAVASGPQPALIAALQAHIARLEKTTPGFLRRVQRTSPWLTGLAAADGHLPASGLQRAALHAIEPQAYGDMPAAMGFGTGLAIGYFQATPEDRRPLLWVRQREAAREYGRLYGHGLETLGLARQRFVIVTLASPAAVLWTFEEALKSGSLSLVLGDAEPRLVSLAMSRRLALAAAAGKSAGLVILSRAAPGPLAAATRWSVHAALSRAGPFAAGAPGEPAFELELIRARGGRPGSWTMEWNRAAHRFDLVSGIPGGALHPYADETGDGGARPERPALRAR